MKEYKMKKFLILTFIALSLLAIFSGCAGNPAGKSEPPNAVAVPSGSPAQSAEAADSIEGEPFDSDKFSIIIAKDWELMDIDGGVQLYKMSGEAVQVYFRGSNMSETEAKSQAESQAKQYGGTTPQEVEKWGNSWWTTTYTAMDLEQLKYLRIEGGQLVSVSAAAKDIESNSDIQGMLESLTFK
jgi:hypothetical protein